MILASRLATITSSEYSLVAVATSAFTQCTVAGESCRAGRIALTHLGLETISSLDAQLCRPPSSDVSRGSCQKPPAAVLRDAQRASSLRVALCTVSTSDCLRRRGFAVAASSQDGSRESPQTGRQQYQAQVIRTMQPCSVPVVAEMQRDCDATGGLRRRGARVRSTTTAVKDSEAVS